MVIGLFGIHFLVTMVNLKDTCKRCNYLFDISWLSVVGLWFIILPGKTLSSFSNLMSTKHDAKNKKIELMVKTIACTIEPESDAASRTPT